MYKKIQTTICWSYFASTMSSEGSPNGYIAAKSVPKIESVRPEIVFFFFFASVALTSVSYLQINTKYKLNAWNRPPRKRLSSFQF